MPVKEVFNPYAIERPHATPQLLERQGSFRIFSSLNQSSPFKRQLSLRVHSSSRQERQRNNSLQAPEQVFGKLANGFNAGTIFKIQKSIELIDRLTNLFSHSTFS